MDPNTPQLITVATVLFTISTAVSAWAWSRTNALSLPIPLSLSIIATFMPLISATIIPLTLALNRRLKHRLPTIPNLVTYLLSLFAAIILTLALSYSHPSPVQTCQLETRWSQLFRTKNADAVRNIQSTLHCCGFNSMHDRAYPFPSRDTDVRTCERTSGYSRRCVDSWRREESRVAGLVGFGGICLLSLVFLIHYITHRKQNWTSQYQADRRPLLEDVRNGSFHDSGRRAIAASNPAGEGRPQDAEEAVVDDSDGEEREGFGGPAVQISGLR